MKLTIDIEHQDLATIAPEEFSALLSVVQRIAIGSAGVKPAESTPKTPKATKATKVSQNNETTVKNDSGKPEKTPVDTPVDTTKADPDSKEEESAQAPETKEEQNPTPAPAPEEEAKTEKEATPAEKVDRKAIVDRVKKIAFDGKAQGVPGKIKAILQGYGVSKLSDLPDDKLEEFLAKVEEL